LIRLTVSLAAGSAASLRLAVTRKEVSRRSKGRRRIVDSSAGDGGHDVVADGGWTHGGK